MIAIVVKPLGLILLFGFTYLCMRAVRRWLPEGKLKRFLLFSWKV